MNVCLRESFLVMRHNVCEVGPIKKYIACRKPMGRKSGSRRRSKPTQFPTATTTAGQRRQVWEGRALQTSGGLTRKDLMKSKSGKIVSKRASAAGKKSFSNNGLAAYAYRSSTSQTPDWLKALEVEN